MVERRRYRLASLESHHRRYRRQLPHTPNGVVRVG